MHEVFGPSEYALCKLRDIQQHDSTFLLPDNALAKGNKLAGRPKPRPLDGATWDMQARGPKAAHIALLFPDSLEDAGP